MSKLNKHVKSISNLIEQIEGRRGNGKLNRADSELLAVLNVCYELLARTHILSNKTTYDKDGKRQFRYIHSSSDSLDEFLFRFATGKGEILLPQLLKAIINHWKPRNNSHLFSQVNLSNENDISYSILNGFLNDKPQMPYHNIEKVINYIHGTTKEVARPSNIRSLKEETIE